LFNTMSGGTARPGTDPHLGLKDILPEADRIRMMEHIYRSRRDWGAASVNFTWGINGAVRGASNRKLVLSDLNLSHGFGPERFGPLARALLLVMRKGAVHKDRHETDKQVCSWRHKNYLLCSNFSTATYVLWCLTHNDTIEFLQANKRERAPWWDIPLIDWDEYSGKYSTELYELYTLFLCSTSLNLCPMRVLHAEASNSTREIYKATKVRNCKLTHHRTAALQYAGFEGLHPFQINSLTNHKNEKQQSAYQSQTEWEVRTCNMSFSFLIIAT